ncbi:MAG: hypothetical protein OXE94_03680 [Aestuariivita sp.]|nr:hypothetical protein [Aestuariivita sp.]MCY4202754.1 hypothetical protein [Aestuariivita sp.]MCY4287052.1 hypothetical protein [Aestuariivita sp.]MCY4347551.1 hypothetical protein [Aestuariivita sp.]
MVRHGRQTEREVMTGIGKVPVRVPKVREREALPTGTASLMVSLDGVMMRMKAEKFFKISFRCEGGLCRLCE